MLGAIVLLRRLSLRQVRERRLRSLLTVGGISVGIALVVAVSLVHETVLESVNESARSAAGSADLEVAAADAAGLPAATVGRVRDVEGVEHAVPVLSGVARMFGDEGPVRTALLGVGPGAERLYGVDFDLAGGGDSDADEPSALLSGDLLDHLGAARGDAVRVETPSGPRAVQIAGRLADSELASVNGGRVALLSLADAQEIFEREDRINSIYVVAEGDDDVGRLGRRLEETLDSGAFVGAPAERVEAFEETFQALTTILSLGSGVGLVVAGFLVFNTMATAVTERRREIATTLMLGGFRRQLTVALAIESALLGLVGSAVGAVLGFGLAQALVQPTVAAYDFVIPNTATGSVVVSGVHLALAIAGGMLVSVAAALVAARRIRRVTPIEVLRPHVPDTSVDGADTCGRRSRRRTILGAALVVAGLAGLALFSFGKEDSVAAVSLALLLAGVAALLPGALFAAVKRAAPLVGRLFGVRGRLAAGTLVSNPRRTSVSVAALLLPTAMAIALGAAIGSYDEEAERAAYAWHGAPLKVSAQTFSLFGADQPLPVELEGGLEDVRGVRHAYPERRHLVDLDGTQVGLYAVPIARSLRDQPEPWISPIRVDERRLVEGLADGEVAISQFMADRRGLAAGDELELPTPRGEKLFRVAGTFDDLTTTEAVFMEFSHYRRRWGDDKADEFSIVLDPQASRSEVSERLEQFVATRNVPAEVLTREQKVAELLETVEGLTSLARALQLAALVVAALAIGTTLFASVHDRRWEFAVGRLVGMRRSEIGQTVLLEAGTVGVIGGIGGLLVGIPLGALILVLLELRFSWEVPYAVPWLVAAAIVVAGVATALAAAIYPRRAALRVPIIEELRYE